MDTLDLNPTSGSSRVPQNLKVVHVEVDKVETNQEGSSVGWRPYRGAWWGRYAWIGWLLLIFLICFIVYWILMTFPPSWILTTVAGTTTQVLDLTKTFFVSLFVSLFIVLIFWLIAIFAC